jgi:hypothetical protein
MQQAAEPSLPPRVARGIWRIGLRSSNCYNQARYVIIRTVGTSPFSKGIGGALWIAELRHDASKLVVVDNIGQSVRCQHELIARQQLDYANAFVWPKVIHS